MIKIDDGREFFYQWDTNRYLTVTEDFQEVHFSRTKFGNAEAVKVEDGKVKVPDEMLIYSGELYVFGIVEKDGKFTKIEKTFVVEKRPKPDNYDGKSNVQIELEKVYSLIGNLEDLNTEQKSNLVSAINEVLEKIGSGGTGSGNDGVGVEKVEQTTTSTEDSGENIITITLTNGERYSFSVFNGSKGKQGKDGTSVTVQSVTESTEDGGENVVAFSDGKTLKVKNGSKGSKGDKGDPGEKGSDGYTPQKRVDYFTEADKAEMVSAVLSNFVDVSEVAL